MTSAAKRQGLDSEASRGVLASRGNILANGGDGLRASAREDVEQQQLARVVEWQTRGTQNPVPATA